VETDLSISGMLSKNKITIILALKSRVVIVGIRALGLELEDH
jgi:hypothetical protein